MATLYGGLKLLELAPADSILASSVAAAGGDGAHEDDEVTAGIAVYVLVAAEARFLYWEIFEQRSYTLDGWITISDGDTVVDAGANIGLFSVWACFEADVHVVHAFEPLPAQQAAIAANIELHVLEGTVKRHAAALGAHAGSTSFTFYPKMPGCSTSKPLAEEQRGTSGMSLAKFDGAVEIHCPVRTLSEVLRTEGIAEVDVLKVDVEGDELAVLRGIGDADWTKIKQLTLEVHQQSLAEVEALLGSKGYAVRVTVDPDMARLGCYNVGAKRESCRRKQVTER